MQGAKGLPNGLDLLGKQIGNLRILFGGGLTNVDVAPSLER